MRWSCLILFAVLMFGSADRAEAEKVRTNQSTKVYSRPGEQATVLLKVDEGQNMTLLEQEGRWLKVRVKGRTGYVPRSKVDMADEEDIARNTRRRPFVDGRSKKRGFGQDEGPDDRIGADAVGEGQEPEPSKAKKASKAATEEEEEEPAPKKKAKKTDEEEEPPPKAAKAKKEDKKKKKVEEEEEAPPKVAAKKKKVEEEEEAPPPKAKKKKVEEDVVDDDKTAEPEEDKRAVAHVSKKVAVYDQPSTKSEELFMVRPTDVLYPIEEKGKWTYVENSEGDSGWVMSDSLQKDNADEEEEGGEDDGAPKRKRSIAVNARMGIMFITQTMRTSGMGSLPTVPDNYNIPVQAPALSIGGGILMPVKKKFLIGADLTYDYAKTFFGGVSYDPDGGTGPMAPVITKLTIHNIGFRVAGGLELNKTSGMALLARIGYRYQAYLVDDYADPMKNPARLPQEVVQAPTLGVGFLMPHLSSKFGLDVALDTILFAGGIKQTAGLEDGSSPSLIAATLGVGVTYHLNKSFDLRAGYDLRWMSINFGAPSMNSERNHTGTNVARTDLFHMFSFGISKPF